MKKTLCYLLTGVMAAGLLAGCGQKTQTGTENTQPKDTAAGQTEASAQTEEPSQEEASGQQEPGGAVTLTAWHDNDEAMMNALADVVNEALAGDNITLKFEKKSDVSSQIRLYGTDAENGPDMYLFAHDSGKLCGNGNPGAGGKPDQRGKGSGSDSHDNRGRNLQGRAVFDAGILRNRAVYV